MPKSLNKVTLIGNLGADPECRSTQNGARVATLSLATSKSWKGPDGQWQEKAQWHRVVVWNAKAPNGPQLADVVEKYCKKGDKLYVEGEIEYRSWQDKEGVTKYTTEINARDIILLGGRDGGEEGGSRTRAAAPAAAAASGSAKAKGKNEFDDMPEALDEEDDDLPF